MIVRTTTAAYNVPSSSAITIMEPNNSRDGFVIHNMGGPVFIKLAKFSSVSHFTFRLPRNGTLEHDGYFGFVSAIAENGTSNIVVTELI